MPKLLRVEARPSYRLWLRYDDGAEGEVSVSHLVGRGVFALWDHEGVFATVTVGPNGEVKWGDSLDLCADSLYLRLTGKAPEEVLPGLPKAQVSA